ncbi:MAG: 3-phosphoshikimate 1-carboxyvinyltransferase [Flavisolibacter sp.]
MKAIVSPSKVKGIITIPASKSAMQRACAAALLKGGETILENPGHSADDKAALDIITQLGATIKYQQDTIQILSEGIRPKSETINCGESGLSVRMFTPIASLSDKEIEITGSGSLLKRPLGFFSDVLPMIGVEFKSKNGYLPMSVKGPLKPESITVDGSLSSQYLTGLLMAYSAIDARDVTLSVKNLNSRPYIDLTLKIMSEFGLKVPVNKNYERFYFTNEHHQLKNEGQFRFRVEADWSGGAFLLVAAAISGEATIIGLDIDSTQADKAILEAMKQSGVMMDLRKNEIQVKKSCIKTFEFDATDCPDLFPPLVCLASFTEGISSIKGVHRLTYKESNRAMTLQEEFGKMGIEIHLNDDVMLIKGNKKIKSAELDSHHDHRIAMACAVTALSADNNSLINHAEAVNKSYPDFWDHLQKLTTGITLK